MRRLGPVCALSALVSLAMPVGPALGAGPAPAQDDSVIVDWIRRNAAPFETCEPRDDHRDLATLRKIVGDAHVVALGEATVGTHEFFQLKRRIVEYLASEMGFTTFAIDASMPEAREMNDYVLHDRGDPGALLANLKKWPLNTEEMLEFVEWMRGFNASGRGRLQFEGFNMHTSDIPVGIVRSFFQRVDPAWVDSVEALTRAMSLAGKAGAKGVGAQAGFPARDAAGHRVRFSGWIRTEDVSGYAELWWRADAESRMVAFNSMEMEHRLVVGTSPWRRYALELDIPANADSIVFGALMHGTGSAWFDSLAVDIDGKPWTDTNRVDLAMESPAGPTGFTLDPAPGYSARMDDSIAAVGRWSLRLSSVKDFVRPDPTQLRAAAEQAARRIVDRFESEGRRYRGASSDEEVEWATQNAHLVLQLAGLYRGEGVRDSCMAANVEWIVERLPKGSKIVLWAHNTHVARAQGTMGDRLAKRFGNDLVVIGLATDEGQCTTTKTTSANLQATEIEPGPDGSFEALARASGVPRFLLDLRRAQPAPVAARLLGGLRMRAIGPATPKQEFWPAEVSREYDAIAWVEKTHATRPRPLTGN